VSDLRPIEPLDAKRHHTERFDCGRPSLNRWLQSYAGQSQRRDVARTFVVTDEPLNIVGYYTLVAGQVERPAATPSVSAGAPRHFPIPICLLARLGVDNAWQGRGIGSDLLRDALRRAVGAADQIGIRAVLVDAIDANAANFYHHYGFEPATDDGLTLMVPVGTIRTRFGELGGGTAPR
jgi:GNAT superfamily N-acetyltransferase